MGIRFLLVLLVLVTASARAVEVTVGRTPISLVEPVGHVVMSADMLPYADLIEKFVPPSNVQLAVFLAESDAKLAASGGVPKTERRFFAQTLRGTLDKTFTTQEFGELKRALITQNERIVADVKKQMPGVLEQINKGLNDSSNRGLELSLPNMIPLPPHRESNRSMAYSMFTKAQVKGENGRQKSVEGVTTVSFIHVKGKVLFLYVSAEKSGLKWSREQADRWADEVIAANPSDTKTSAAEAAVVRKGINWTQVGIVGLVGGIVGGILTLLKRRNA